jgi:hypothetical protein
MALWFFFSIVLFMSVEFIGTMRHETAHQVIFQEYGCNATMKFGLFGGETVPSCPDLSEAQGLSLASSQAMVEAYGYQNRLLSEILALVLSTVFMILIIVDIGTDEREK